MRPYLRALGIIAIAVAVSLSTTGCGRHPTEAQQQSTAALPQSTPASLQQPANGTPRSFEMIAVGDVMTDRSVWKAIQSNGVHSILAKVQPELAQADLRFCNLECPLSTVGPHDPKNCSFRADPRGVEVLRDGKFDVVSVANNHFLNAGREAVLQTLSLLKKNNIAYAGAHVDRTKSSDPVFLTVKGLNVGLMAYTDLDFEHGSYSKVDPAREAFAAQVKAAKSQCDVLFVSFHWGTEYQPLPSVRQRKLGHLAIDSGADCVLGHHPHTLEGIESYRGRPILYSMGNFVFDQREGERMESAIFHLTYEEGKAWHIKATPVWIPHSRMGPIYPEKARADKILARLAKISTPLSTNLTIEAGRALLDIDATGASTSAKTAVPVSGAKAHANDRRQ